MSARKQSCALVETRARRFSSGAIRPFETDAAVLEATALVVRLRAAMAGERSPEAFRRLATLEVAASRRLHQRLSVSAPDLALVALTRGHRFSRCEREIVLILAAAALGVIDAIRDVEDVQQQASDTGRARLAVVRALAPDGRLARAGVVEVEEDEVPIDRRVGLSSRSIRRLLARDGTEEGSSGHPVGGRARTPVVTREQLVLGERVRAAFDMVVAQARHARVMIDEWGLGGVIAYGRGVTALFSGPSGVGKTAAAEAMASELGRRILVVSYAEIQSCWVGDTEKHIVRTFREAAKEGAVLFWDEADAMFGDRALAERSWEIRDVNVLLQELERFEGLCILATNRRVSLDPALERRIAIKVVFERPNRGARLAIWRKLLPATLPLAGVDVEVLADEDLSGGEIKNVVINAARLALVRSPSGPLCAADFDEAVRMEREGRWSRRAGAIGFGGRRQRA